MAVQHKVKQKQNTLLQQPIHKSIHKVGKKFGRFTLFKKFFGLQRKVELTLSTPILLFPSWSGCQFCVDTG